MTRRQLNTGPRIPCLAGSLTLSHTAVAQHSPASPDRYTEAKTYPVRRAVQLPGTVELQTVSLVATEVEGLVEELSARESRPTREE